MEYTSGQFLPKRQDKVKRSPKGRICQQEGCSTVLSAYNHTEYCSLHANPRKKQRELMRDDDA